MRWIGLTGGIATGKSTVANMLRDLGLSVVDADALARQVVQKNSPGLKAVVEAFGPEIIDAKGELNRFMLGKIVFADKQKRERLEEILHPLIQELRAQERRRLEQDENEIAFYDVPLLFEKKMEGEFDAIVLVFASLEVQQERLKTRNLFSAEDIENRLAAQMPIDEKLKKSDYVIFNQSSLSDLKRNVHTVLSELQAL